MKLPRYQEDWPESWRESYTYDLQEVFGKSTDLGYTYAYANRRKQTLRLLQASVPRGATVLDIAAGQGNFSIQLAEYGYDVTWNDLRAELEPYVRSKFEFGQMSYAPGNAFELEVPTLFDAVLITEVIEHVAHPDEFLQNVRRLLRPGGVVIMTTPNGAYFRNRLPRFSDCEDPSAFEAIQFRPNSNGHIFLLHPDEVFTLAESAGLRVDEFVLFTNPLTSGHVKLWPLLRIVPQSFVERLESMSQRLPRAFAEKLLIQVGVRLMAQS